MSDKLDMEVFLLGRKVKKWTKFNVTVTAKQIQWRKPKEGEYTLPLAYPLTGGCTYCLLSEPDQLKALKAPHCLLLQNSEPLYIYAEKESDTVRLVQFLADRCGLRLEKPLTGKLVLPHAFRKKNFSRSVLCHFCSDPFGGSDNPGYKCVVCGYTMHKRCKSGAPAACGHRVRPPPQQQQQQQQQHASMARKHSTSSSTSLSVKELSQQGSNESLPERCPPPPPARRTPSTVSASTTPSASGGSRSGTGNGDRQQQQQQQSRHQRRSGRSGSRKERSSGSGSNGNGSLSAAEQQSLLQPPPAAATQQQQRSRSGEAGKHEQAAAAGDSSSSSSAAAAAGADRGGHKRWPSAKGQSRREQLDDIKLAVQDDASIVRSLELDDCGNLCFELSPGPPAAVADQQSTQPPPPPPLMVTLMVPEAYPNGDFMLFSATGEVHELGKGRSLKHIVNRLIIDHARRTGQRPVPLFAEEDDDVASSEHDDDDSEFLSPRPSKDSEDGEDQDEEEDEEDEEEDEEASGGYEYAAAGSGTADDIEHDLGAEVAKGAVEERIMELVVAVRKLHGDKSAGVYCDLTGDYTVRFGLPLSFLDVDTANSWGVDQARPLVVEFVLSGPYYYLDGTQPPAVQLYQSSDRRYDLKALRDVASFGLQWQLTARINDWLKRSWPPKDGHFMLQLIAYMVDCIHNCNKNCIICNSPLAFQMLKPAVCDSPLCLYSHEQYGLGADVASFVRAYGETVDLLVSCCAAAANGDPKRFSPFPSAVEVKLHDKASGKVTTHNFISKAANDAAAVRAVLNKLPPVSELAAFPDTRALKQHLDSHVDPLAFPLLRWIVTSNRAHLVKLDPKDHIKQMGTPHQYLFMSSPPEKERNFQQLKAKHGSFYAFHGSPFGNWHSILRVGLKNFSNTSLMTTGAVYGAGVYLAPDSGTSLGYARSATGWDKSIFGKGGVYLQCVCLCEVISAGYKANPHYVINNEDHVMTRYFFIYASGTMVSSVNASSLKSLLNRTAR